MKHLFFLLLLPAVAFGQSVTSRLEIFDLKRGQRSVVHTDTVRFEAPNWTRDGRFLIINEKGKLYTVAVKGGRKEVINTDFADRCNNDHGLSPDGQTIVISHNDSRAAPNNNSRIFTVPLGGGTPKLITEKAPSYWHGWSPDGHTLAYVAEREHDGKKDYDIYSIPADGSSAVETRLTDSPGLDDGPDYSPDGRYVYFNSVRSGKMHIWRMDIDGQNPIQITRDQYNNWFPHPSPNGRYVVFITYLDDINPNQHPADKNVALRLLDLKSGKIRELTRLRGGQGTINVPSWSPDSKRFAFVSY